MAKGIYICSKEALPASVEKQLYEICKKLAPDNITPFEPRIVLKGDIAFGVMNPYKTLLVSGNSLLIGQIFGKNEKWDIPLQEFPDGSYALFRDGKEFCEIVTDPVASRTIWYYLDENVFIASTSQRAIIMYLGNFEFDERVIPWMLSTGSLGPTFSWDKRIKRVPVDSSVILDKRNWSISTKSNPIVFHAAKKSDEQHEKQLRESLKTTIKSLNLDYSKWALPLSGGYDSRGILFLLRDNNLDIHRLRTITWGLKSSLDVKGNDAYIAKKLANELDLCHKYYITDQSEEPIDRIINRFVLLSEGRTDNLASYMDGFIMWKTLFEDGIEGTIRGDECFGYLLNRTPLRVRLGLDFCLCSDFSNLKDYTKYGFPVQEMPPHLCQRKGETILEWQDRLFIEYRIPTVQAALADLKVSYLEQTSPLLSKIILYQVRQLPDHLRCNKTLFKRIVIPLSPEIEYATSDSDPPLRELLKRKQILALLKNELHSNAAMKLFPAEFLDYILKGMKSGDQIKTAKTNSFSLKSLISRIVPHFIKDTIRSKALLPSVDHNILALRILIISKMNKILDDDCQ